MHISARPTLTSGIPETSISVECLRLLGKYKSSQLLSKDLSYTGRHLK